MSFKSPRKSLYDYLQAKDITGYLAQLNQELTQSEQIYASNRLSKVMSIGYRFDGYDIPEKLIQNQYMEPVLEDGNGLYLDDLMRFHLEIFLAEHSKLFRYITRGKVITNKWHKRILILRAIASHIRSAKTPEDLADYLYELDDPHMRCIVCMNIKRYQTEYPDFLETLSQWFEWISEQDQNIFVRGITNSYRSQGRICDQESTYETLSEKISISCHQDDLNNPFEICLGKDATLAASDNQGIFIDYDVIDFLVPALIDGNGQFIDTSYDLFDVEEWQKTILEFTKLAHNIREAKSLPDLNDYMARLSPHAEKVIKTDFEKFQKVFPVYLDDLILWLKWAVTQDDKIWLRGL